MVDKEKNDLTYDEIREKFKRLLEERQDGDFLRVVDEIQPQEVTELEILGIILELVELLNKKDPAHLEKGVSADWKEGSLDIRTYPHGIYPYFCKYVEKEIPKLKCSKGVLKKVIAFLKGIPEIGVDVQKWKEHWEVFVQLPD